MHWVHMLINGASDRCDRIVNSTIVTWSLFGALDNRSTCHSQIIITFSLLLFPLSLLISRSHINSDIIRCPNHFPLHLHPRWRITIFQWWLYARNESRRPCLNTLPDILGVLNGSVIWGPKFNVDLFDTCPWCLVNRVIVGHVWINSPLLWRVLLWTLSSRVILLSLIPILDWVVLLVDNGWLLILQYRLAVTHLDFRWLVFFSWSGTRVTFATKNWVV